MLFELFMVTCTKMERTRTDDGEGGTRSDWVPGDAFQAAVVRASTSDPLLAEKATLEGEYTVTTDAFLSFHDAFRRESDGTTFRVVGINDPAPGMATFAFNQYRADRWELP